MICQKTQCHAIRMSIFAIQCTDASSNTCGLKSRSSGRLASTLMNVNEVELLVRTLIDVLQIVFDVIWFVHGSPSVPCAKYVWFLVVVVRRASFSRSCRSVVPSSIHRFHIRLTVSWLRSTRWPIFRKDNPKSLYGMILSRSNSDTCLNDASVVFCYGAYWSCTHKQFMFIKTAIFRPFI